MLINLNKSFPVGREGSHGPLPKQKEFLYAALDPNGPKYIAYVGGIGSGKTLIGCITVLCWAVMYGGDYLIARQFAPELKITTLKTFLEICPPELIVEYRVADGIVKIKSRTGKPATIIFRQLEEPDKLRSLNLAGAYVDEASQTTEAGFMLLQGRLRGLGLRKLILTTNPAGHDWIWRWFVNQDFFKAESSKKMFKLIKAPSTENVHLPEGYVQSVMETWSEDRIRREIFGDFDSFEGQVYSDFRADVHVVQPFAIPDEWERVAGMDHGYRNPACCLWGAVDYDGNVYIYREFYEREWLIEEICGGKTIGNQRISGIVALTAKERLQGVYIDPSTRNRRGTTGLSDHDTYLECLPDTFPLKMANNDKTSGIDKVKSYLKVNPRTNKPRLFIFSTCRNLLDEIATYRYQELTMGQVGQTNEKEEPKKVNDHSMDALRYLIMSRPELPNLKDIQLVKPGSIEAALKRDFAEAQNELKAGDPFDDQDS